MDPYIEPLPLELCRLHSSDDEQSQQWSHRDCHGSGMEPLPYSDVLLNIMSSCHWGPEAQGHYPSSIGTLVVSGYSIIDWPPFSRARSAYLWPETQIDRIDPSQSAQGSTPVETLSTMTAARKHFSEDYTEPISTENSGWMTKELRKTTNKRFKKKPTTLQEAPISETNSKLTRCYVPTTHSHKVTKTESLSRIKKGPYRVKNKAAAKRCREKTKQYEADLVAKEKQVMQDRAYLEAYVTMLKNEVLSLRSQILEHGECECEAIQRYIIRTANNVIGGSWEAF